MRLTVPVGRRTNFILSPYESEVIPLPDAIITMGEITKDRLEKNGWAIPTKLQIGCALRQADSFSLRSSLQRGRIVRNILVAFATSLLEYVLTLSFLHEAFKKGSPLSFRLRPHPTISLEEAFEILPNGHVGFEYEVSSAPVPEDIEWADVVIYASSTIGLEAVGSGKPAIYLDLGDILDTDPMEGWSGFKWIAREPAFLLSIFSEIEELSDSNYKILQEKALNYARSYLRPVTDQSLKIFCEN